MTWRLLDLFSGIGGFSLAAQWVWEDELEIVAFCEIDKYCQKVLHKHWPNVPIIEDVRDVTEKTLANSRFNQPNEYSRGIPEKEGNLRRDKACDVPCRQHPLFPIDLLTGGFPCQPFSVAGKRKGKEDNRFLWPEMFAVIKEIRPRWVVAENVAGIVRMALDDCLFDLEGEGYSTGTVIIPACAVNAPHRRDRVWIIANRDNGGWWKLFQQEQIKRGNITTNIGSNGKIQYMAYPESGRKISTQQSRQRNAIEQGSQDVADTERILPQGFGDRRGQIESGRSDWWSTEPDVGRVAHGVPNRVDRLKSLGNAIVPQIAYQIFRAIKEIEMNICPHNGPKMTHSNGDIECLLCNEIIGKGRK